METPATAERHPALHPWCRVARDGDRYLLEHGRTVVTLEGRAASALLPELLPRLDGRRTLEEIVAELGQAVAPAIEHAVSLLDANQLLVDGSSTNVCVDDGRSIAATFVAATGRRTTADAAVDALGAACVVVLGSGETAATVAAEVARTGVGRVEVHDLGAPVIDADLVIAAPAPGEVSQLDAVNRACLASGAPWIQVLPFDGRSVVVGPLYLPHVSACRACYVLRRSACSGYEADYGLVERAALRAESPPFLTAIAAGLAAVVALRWVTTQDPTLPGRLYALDVGTVIRLSHDHLLRVPRCSACGPTERAVPSPWFEAAG